MAYCRLFGITGLAHDVFVVESALPVVSQITVLAGTFGADDKYAATGATLTTIGCFFTIPVLMVLMG
jgi:predicted permease